MNIIAPMLVVLALLASCMQTPADVRCRIVGNHEIDNHHCIPYCPPDPRECE